MSQASSPNLLQQISKAEQDLGDDKYKSPVKANFNLFKDDVAESPRIIRNLLKSEAKSPSPVRLYSPSPLRCKNKAALKIYNHESLDQDKDKVVLKNVNDSAFKPVVRPSIKVMNPEQENVATMMQP